MKLKLYACIGAALLLQSTYVFAKAFETKDANITNNTPLAFIENKGQVTDQDNAPRRDIDYKLVGNGMSLFIGDGQLHYQWRKDLREAPPQLQNSFKETREAFLRYMEQGAKSEYYRMDVTLVGADKNAQAITEEINEYSENYHLAHFKGTVSSYNKVTYRNIYPNIDWVLYSRDNEVKYDFIVHPGGDPKNIRLQYNGANTLKLKDGALIATTPFGSVTEQKPYTYNAATRAEIASSFKLSENTLSFNIAANSSVNDIVIDPFLDWATYYGGGGGDYGLDVAGNTIGDVYMTGYTTSTNNIVTVGAFQTTLGGNWDAFIVKFNTSGVRQWATYFGGTGQDWLSSAVCDPSGNLYVAGETYSPTGVTTVGAYQTVIGGSDDALLAKFTPAGTLIWSTYFGGPNWEYGDVACDASGNVYMAGQTYSTTGIATPGAYQTTISGVYDAYLSRWTSAGVLVWATYYGGPGYEWGSGIECDPAGNIYVGGGTESTTGIATVGAHQTTLGNPTTGGWDDGYLSKWTSAGTLTWATYYGGTNHDWISDIACDATGNVYASGYTYSTNAIATVGSHQPAHGSGTNTYDGFIVKFNPTGVQQWGTYYGGTGFDYASGLDVGINGYLYVSGWTGSTNAIATTNGHQTTLSGLQDGFLAEFTQAGVCNWGTYYGGPGNEYFWGGSGNGGNGIAATATGKLYFTATTQSSSGISTINAHQTSHGGTNTYDGFLTSWIIDTIVYIHQPYNDTSLCPGQSFNLRYWTTYNFRTGNVFTAQLSNATGSFTSPITIGSKTDIDSGLIPVTIPRNMTPGTGYRIRIVASNPARTSVDNGKNIVIKPLPQVTASSNSPVCENAALNLNAASTTPGAISYNWSGPLGFSASNNQSPTRVPVTLAMAGRYAVTAALEGCLSYDTTDVVINIIPATPVAGGNSPACPNTPINLTALSATPGVTYSWTGPSFTSPLQNPNVTNSATTAMAGRYIVTASRFGCVSEPDTMIIEVDITTPTPVITGNTTLCAGGDLNLSALNIPGATYAWTGPGGFTSTQRTPTITAIQPWQAGKYTVIATLNNCVSLPAEVTVQVNVVSTIGAYASPNDTICQGATATFIAFPQNPGLIPEYQWYKNFQPITGADKLIYTSNSLVTGDRIYCQMIAAGVCDNPIIATTDTFDMVVLPIVTVPAVTITANPGLGVSPQQQVVFTANVQNGGTTPKYQWYKNGTLQAGARYATWTTSGMNFGDRISVQIISEDPCANEKTAGDTVVIGHPTSIRDNGNSNKGLKLYPNPNKGSFTVSGISGREVTVAISNVIGQVVYKETAKNIQGQLELSTRLPKGVYLLRINNEDNKNDIIKFTITEE